MSEFVTLRSYNYLHELAIDRAKLHSIDIESFVRDEYMAQIYQLMPSVGGIKLMVYEEDAERALAILSENDPLVDEDQINQQPVFWNFLNERTDNIPLFNMLPVEIRAVVLLVVILLLIIIPVYLLV